MGDYALFAIAFFAAAISPGADTALVLSRALESPARAWLSGAGITLAKLVLLVVSYFGAAALMEQNPGLIFAVKLLGAAFLSYRALVLWRRTELSSAPKSDSALADFGIGFATAFTNPQPLAFYLAIVPQVASTTDLSVLGLIVIMGFAIVTLIYASLAVPIRGSLSRTGPGLINRIVAVLLLAVAVWILLR
ncbi:MAG: hypothetical protein RIS08_99 [Actinomycetota bacterium]|jgi:threonine/homoserine/homoserine lactone efflux protein